MPQSPPLPYPQVFWVSIGDPEYKFVVYREAVRSLASYKINVMLNQIMVKLYGAHQDKHFDVVATVCDGAAEQ